VHGGLEWQVMNLMLALSNVKVAEKRK
jgi:hypothetical protein